MKTLVQKIESTLQTKKTPSLHEKELYEHAQLFVRMISWIPGIRMIAVSNSLAMHATHPSSDIDLFIITSVNRLWIVRAGILAMAIILNVRTRPGNEAGKFCFPFFMTDKNLSLQSIAIEKDVYLAYWTYTLKPLYNRDYTYGRFMEVNKAWYEEILEEFSSPENHQEHLNSNRIFLIEKNSHAFSILIWKWVSPLLWLLDRWLSIISKKIIFNKIHTTDQEGVIVNDDMIKIHTPDRRREIREQVLMS
jgi:hypothetical protein